MASGKGSSKKMAGRDGQKRDMSYITMSWTIDEDYNLVIAGVGHRLTYQLLGIVGKVSVQKRYNIPSGERGGETVVILSCDIYRTADKAFSSDYQAKSCITLVADMFFHNGKGCRTLNALVKFKTDMMRYDPKNYSSLAGSLTFEL